MHKLSLYLNDDQYKLLEELSAEKSSESAEECANTILYEKLRIGYSLEEYIINLL